jgi:hypothetical protein
MLENSEFVISRIGDSLESVSPVSWGSYVVTVFLGLAAVAVGLPGTKAATFAILLIVLMVVIVLLYLNPLLSVKRGILREIQQEVFVERTRFDHSETERVVRLLKVINQVQRSLDFRKKTYVRLRTQAFEIVRN